MTKRCAAAANTSAKNHGIIGVFLAGGVFLTALSVLGRGMSTADRAVAAGKFAKLRHPATWLAIGVNLFILLLEPIGRSPEVQRLLKAAIRG